MSLVRVLLFLEQSYGFWIPEGEITGDALKTSARLPPPPPACSMPGDLPLNGCDYLMLGFDHELRRRGYAGNSCQIILELPRRISVDALKSAPRVSCPPSSDSRRRPGESSFQVEAAACGR